MPTLFLAAVFFLIGLVFGSFGNALVIRLASGETLGGRSHCPHCKKTIAAYDLVPLFSFLLLQGKCRYCKKPIALRYFLMEFLCGILFLFAFFQAHGDIALAIATAVICFGLLLVCAFDFYHQQIPDLFTGIILVGALATMFITHDFYNALIGAGIGIGWFGFQWIISKGTVVGSGDIWLAGALGVWLGASGTVAMLMASYIVGAAVASYLLLTKRVKFKKSYLPFGPFLAIGSIISAIWFTNLF